MFNSGLFCVEHEDEDEDEEDEEWIGKYDFIKLENMGVFLFWYIIFLIEYYYFYCYIHLLSIDKYDSYLRK